MEMDEEEEPKQKEAGRTEIHKERDTMQLAIVVDRNLVVVACDKEEMKKLKEGAENKVTWRDKRKEGRGKMDRRKAGRRKMEDSQLMKDRKGDRVTKKQDRMQEDKVEWEEEENEGQQGRQKKKSRWRRKGEEEAELAETDRGNTRTKEGEHPRRKGNW